MNSNLIGAEKRPTIVPAQADGGGPGDFVTQATGALVSEEQQQHMSSNLKEIINSLIEKKGRFQVILIILICLNSIQVGINHTITSFHAYVPKFYCKDDPDVQCGLVNNGTSCPSGYEFDEEDERSVVVEWSLVCDRHLIMPLINTLYFVGVTLGALICGTLADMWGRKYLVLLCMYLQAIISVCIYFTPSLEVFVFFRILQGFFIQGLQNCSYTLMLEYCPARFRTAAAVFWELNWAVGLGILGAVAYFIRTWRDLTLVLTIPTAISLFYFWVFPESISWLYAKGRYKEACALTRKIAKKNSDEYILEECSKIPLREKGELPVKLDNGEGDGKAGSQTGILDMVKSRPLRRHLIIMICVWFSVTLSYYGILYFLPGLAGQRHMNFLVGAAIEAIAYILAYFVLSRFGRRWPMSAYQYINGVLCITMGLLSMCEDSPAKQWSLIVIALIAKGLAVSSFCGMFIYCSELFPTICRGVALGLCGFAARCGSLLAPQLMILAVYAPTYVPMIILATGLLITGTATLFLPETLQSRLPNTISEANDLWDKFVSKSMER